MKKNTTKRILLCLLGVILVILSVFGTLSGMIGNLIGGKEVKEAVLHNPVVDMDAMCAGQKVTWDCVWFGSYPQTEVKSTDDEYEALQSAEGWDDNGDIVMNDNVINGTKYRRMLRSDATYATSGEKGYYDWEDYTTYRYFKYEPVKWRVLKTDGDSAMLLSDIVLDDRNYNKEWKNPTTWEVCTMRSWLNGYNADMNREGIDYSNSNFIDSAFTIEEQSAIVDTNGIKNTMDKLFLLSMSEVYADTASVYGFAQDTGTYDEARRCKSSDYAKAMGVYSDIAIEGNCRWWLCSPGSYSFTAAFVGIYGDINYYGHSVDSNYNGVRVALNLNLSSSNLYTYAGTVCSDGIITESEKAEENISNPRIKKVADAQEGQNVKWDCVYFGSYPQTEIKKADSEYAVLQRAEGWDNNGDIVINNNVMNDNVINNNVLNGTKYRRMLKGDATYATSGDENHYNWEDDTTYHYFRYEPIKWRVLKTDGDSAMLLSDIVLDDREYNTEYEDTTWETSTIRSWLNGYNADMNQEGINYSSSNFIDSAFTIEERSAIEDTNVANYANMYYGIEGGNKTMDKLFLLSELEICTKEAKTYGFSTDCFVDDISRGSKSSDYAKAMGVFSNTSYKGNCLWWLRSPGGYSSNAANVNCEGCISNLGYYVSNSDNGVRVALNLNLSSSNLYTYAGTVYSDGTVNTTEEPSTE
ncbi:MAG: hypothetical protein K2I03_00850 [Lachnospiraceae bacterium]|nr:hypothetical protein [Lachnospiraceae bacterium]MDE6251039.1 hypothetical protein [Lachnospiraceae bacterium]